MVSKMKVQMDKCDAQYKPQVYQSKSRGENRCNNSQNHYTSRNRSYSRDREGSISFRGRGSFGRSIDQIIEVDFRIILGKITDRTIIEIILGKTIEMTDIEIQDLEIDVVVVRDIEIIKEIIQERILNKT